MTNNQLKYPANKPYPTKRTLNLAKRETHKKSIAMLTVGILVIAAVSFSISKFGVYDQYKRLHDAESEYMRVHNEHIKMTEEVLKFPELEKEYLMYSHDFIKNDPVYAFTDRRDVLTLLRDEMMSKGRVISMRLIGDRLSVSMSEMNLKEISNMIASLKEQPVVKNVSMTIAEIQEEYNSDILNFSVVLELKKLEADNEEDNK